MPSKGRRSALRALAGASLAAFAPRALSQKSEGALTLYTTIAEKDLPAIVGPFEKKTGIKVTVWRAGTDKVLQRAIAETRAGRHDFDVVHFGSPEMEALSREKILKPVDSPVQADLAPGSLRLRPVRLHHGDPIPRRQAAGLRQPG